MHFFSSAAVLGATFIGLVSAQAPTATADDGVFVGIATTVPGGLQPVKKFLGMPYAVSPPQRFSPPVRPANSNKVQQATRYASNCIQIDSFGDEDPGTLPAPASVQPGPDSEDCLYVNVFAPNTPPPVGGYPVMFFIYGGAFANGASSAGVYDGSYLAANNSVIVVTFNYRLNVFGFPGTLPGLPVGQQNLGLLDQRLALDWTRRNIAGFGGNPLEITIFGESAGATSVDFLLLTTPAVGAPFRGAIMESGSFYLSGNGIGLLGPQNPPPPPPIQTLSQEVGCGYDDGTLACLRTKTTAQLQSAASHLPWQPVPDNGITVPTNNDGDKVRSTGGGARVPIMTGTNADEGSVFVIFGSPGTFDYLFSEMFPELAPYQTQIRAAYPIGGCNPRICMPDEAEAVSAVVTDYLWTCIDQREGISNTASGVPTYRYYFNTSLPGSPPPVSNDAIHTAELPYVFGTYDPAVATPNERALTQYMMKAWSQFAKNPLTGPGWKPFTGLPGLKEIAALGGPGNPTGESDIDTTVVDVECGIYQPIYAQRDPLLRRSRVMARDS